MMNRHESWGQDADDEKGGWVSADGTVMPPATATTATQQPNEHSHLNEKAAAAARPRVHSFSSTSGANHHHHGGGNAAAHHHHRRYKSSLGDMFASTFASLGSISEEVQHNVGHTFQDELQSADTGRKFFLDMTMSRNMSVLPEQLPQLMREARTGQSTLQLNEDEEQEADNYEALEDQQQQQQALLPTSTTTTKPKGSLGLLPYLSLLAAVLAVSSSGSAIAMLKGVTPPLKFYWRTTATALVFLPFALRTLVVQAREARRLDQTTNSSGAGNSDGETRKTNIPFFPRLTTGQWCTFFAAALSWTTSVLLCIYAYDYTSIGNVVIGANSQAIILLLGKVLVGQQLHWMEGMGVLVAFAGCILCSTDEVKDPDQVSDDQGHRALYGDAMALASGFFGVGYLTFAKAVRSNLPVFVFMFLVMVTGSCLAMLFMAVTSADPLQWTLDPFDGLFGWMTVAQGRIYILLYMAIVCHVVGSAGFVRAMAYFENIIIAVATLLEPITATLIATALGVGQLPGTMGWIGNALVVLGTLGVVYPSVQKGGDGGH